jgi:hypothetical protein
MIAILRKFVIASCSVPLPCRSSPAAQLGPLAAGGGRQSFRGAYRQHASASSRPNRLPLRSARVSRTGRPRTGQHLFEALDSPPQRSAPCAAICGAPRFPAPSGGAPIGLDSRSLRRASSVTRPAAQRRPNGPRFAWAEARSRPARQTAQPSCSISSRRDKKPGAGTWPKQAMDGSPWDQRGRHLQAGYAWSTSVGGQMSFHRRRARA